jgi:hypothetical protein
MTPGHQELLKELQTVAQTAPPRRRSWSAWPNSCTKNRPATTTWEAEVNKMNKTFGAAIPDDATKKIIEYLQARYTVEPRKP